MGITNQARGQRPGKQSPSRQHSWTGNKAVAWLAVIAAVVVIVLPTAVVFGLADALFSGPKEGVKSIAAGVAVGAVMLVASFAWEIYRDRKKASSGRGAGSKVTVSPRRDATHPEE